MAKRKFADGETQWRALMLVRDGLRSGGIPAHNFSMGVWFGGFDSCGPTGPHCGSIGCIGGWMEALLYKAGYEARVDDSRMSSLFYGRMHSVTPDEAADAIDRYLAGKYPWPPYET